ncbi:MAG: hypothetical protein DI537_05200 [Stutzerimonas stutzeri]|nr:MAG: hypothetical protein DI537_05200 [Stutzerimonas stutzeri]
MLKHENITVPRISIDAWYSHPQTAHAIAEVTNDRLLHRKRKVEISRYDLNELVQRYTDNTTPDLMILEIDGDAAEVLDALERIANVTQGTTKAIVICQVNDVKFYKKMIDYRLSGYLLGPATTSELLTAIANIYAPNGTTARGRITAVIGAAGGVGSSTIAQNIAWNMAEVHGRQTLLVDGDIAFGSALLSFNQNADRDLGDALWAEDVDETFLGNIMIPLGDRLELLPSPASLEKATNFETVRVERVLDAIRNSSPNVVIDLPHEWGVLSNHVINEADDVIVVGTPDILGLRNTKAMIKYLAALRSDISASHYVINNSGIPKRVAISEEEFLQAIGIPPLAVLPYDPALFSAALAEGRPFTAMHPSSPITGQFSDIALKLLDEVSSLGAPEPIEAKPPASSKLMTLLGAVAKKPAKREKIDLSASSKKGGIFASLKSSMKKKSA